MKSIAKIIVTTFIVLVPPLLTWHTFVHPLISYIDARDWIATETTSLRIGTTSRRGKTHTNVQYTFEHSEGDATGDTVQFWPGSHRNTVDPRLDGVSSSIVWYDAENPGRSVIFRDFDKIGFAFGLIPTCLSLLSVWILFGLFSSSARSINEEAEQVGDGDAEEAV